MKREPFIAHSELTNEIYIIVGKEKYRVTEQAIKAVKAIKALEQESVIDKIRIEIEKQIIPRSSYTDKQKKQVLAIIDKYRSELDCHECKTAHDCYECGKYKENEE